MGNSNENEKLDIEDKLDDNLNLIKKAIENEKTVDEYQKLNNNSNLIAKTKKKGIFDKYGKYIHKIHEETIDCPHILRSQKAMKCPIYYAMKQKYHYIPENLQHLNEYKHFKNEFQEKPKCKYGDECKVYIRSEQGQDDNRTSDKCHMKLYRHPPRTRQIKLAQNIHSLLIHRSSAENHGLYHPSHDSGNYEKYGPMLLVKTGYLTALMEEVTNNGYKYDLCLKCCKMDDCQHTDFSILKIVAEKMNCSRHKLMGAPLQRHHMLALILYTGCDCNYDLCKSQRNGDYLKWKWFDLCLYEAIQELSKNEAGSFSVFSGLNGVKLDAKKVKEGYFVTYVSTSWRREVSQTFMGGNEGMMIEIDKKYKSSQHVCCCDVSWISKFPDECEVLFARSLEGYTIGSLNNFSCSILDDSNGIQTILLKKKRVKLI